MTHSFLEILKQKIIVFDGATGTHLQDQGLSADDFGGEQLDGIAGARFLRQLFFGQKIEGDGDHRR